VNPDHFFIDALTIAGGFGAVALGILATTRAQEWRDARRKRRQDAEFRLAAAENVNLAARTLLEPDRSLDFIGKRLRALEDDSNSQKHVNRDACARADGIEAKLSKLTQASDALDHWIHKVEGKTEELHESLVSHARDIDRLDGRIDTLAKRRAPKKRAR
jgi:uncharacterized protein YdcH (DUF465 family)